MGKKKSSKRRAGAEPCGSDNDDVACQDLDSDEIDVFHRDRDKVAVDADDNVTLLPSFYSSQVEILNVDDSDDDDNDESLVAMMRKESCRQKNDLRSDLEDSDGDETDGAQRWGSKTRHFYSSGHPKKDLTELSDSEPNDFQLEELEAKLVQRRQARLLDERDFDVALIEKLSSSSLVQADKVAQDLTELSVDEKLQLLSKESPELLRLVDKFKSTVDVLKCNLLPLYSHCINCPRSTAASTQFLQEKLALYIDFCICVSFYLVLKASREPNMYCHPVVKRILEYQMLMKRLEVVELDFKAELDDIWLEMSRTSGNVSAASVEDICKDKVVINRAEETVVSSCAASATVKCNKKKNKKGVAGGKLSQLIDSDSDSETSSLFSPRNTSNDNSSKTEKIGGEHKQVVSETLVQDDETTMVNPNCNDDHYEDDDEDDMTDGRRAVTREILKNRGLTPRRNKDYKNPRVKHRLKYRRAKIRRRGQIREVHKELKPYSGEFSGIRAAVKRGIKLH